MFFSKNRNVRRKGFKHRTRSEYQTTRFSFRFGVFRPFFKPRTPSLCTLFEPRRSRTDTTVVCDQLDNNENVHDGFPDRVFSEPIPTATRGRGRAPR